MKCHDIIKEKCIQNILTYKMHYDPFGIIKTNSGGYHSDIFNDTKNQPVLDSLLIDETWYLSWRTEVLKHAEKFILQFNPKFIPQMSMNFWININGKYDCNIKHNHFPMNENKESRLRKYTFLSGCYYLKKPKDSGNIIFTENPVLVYLKPLLNFNFNESINCEDGDLLLFFPHQEHYVEPSKADEERISISFNIFQEKPQ